MHYSINKYLVDDVHDRDLVGLRIGNTENVQDKVVGISLRRRDKLKLIWAEVYWGRSFKAVLGLDLLTDSKFI